ncbi:acyl-CoA dehydrogenase family protein [Rhizobium rhizogenes]|uniref:acyl-CoA dehydrogenase family protein n=1 Tax=Rhizobium rhizogenes TaxID=359 RepID=UPI001571BE07|nr:acyl-CoA dehydrogenase family protein [Rhizobium rhizogenes]NTI78664.1 monooxygenase [Rhizobium rhizogenes]
MTDVNKAWGAGPSERYDAIAEPFRPIFKRIGDTAIARETARRLPYEEVLWLREAGFTTLRLPVEYGGPGITLPELFALFIELSEADPNLTNAFRSHFGFIEEVLDQKPSAWRDTWLGHIAAGEMAGSAGTELGNQTLGKLSTRLVRKGDRYVLNGEKYYTTGSIFADWLKASADGEDGERFGVMVPTSAPGVEIIDDWDGFGQRLSASGTARFNNVVLDPELIRPTAGVFRYSGAFFQLVHLAELAGIGRAASSELATLVSERQRIYGGRSVSARPSEDPQLLQVVGRVRAASYSAGAIAIKATEALQRAADLAHSTDEVARKQAYTLADLECSQSVTIVTDLIFEATTILFDALGASAAKSELALDRHWRNARTISSHNPRVYHDRIVGDYAVNGTTPPAKGGVGVAAPPAKAPATAKERA